MRVLVIPDVHLKPILFEHASELIKRGEADRAVCLMDIADDWRQQYNLDLYMQTYDAAIRFSKEFPDTLWCYGNHDLSYLWQQKESGYSPIAPWVVCEKMRILKESFSDEKQMAYLHRIDNVLFSHGGLADEFVRKYVPVKYFNDIDMTIKTINSFDWEIMWQDLSPIWYRPQYYTGRMYKPRKLLQVVGHTPVKEISKKGSIISCDVFSIGRNGRPIGSREFLVIDTVAWEFHGVKLTEERNE